MEKTLEKIEIIEPVKVACKVFCTVNDSNIFQSNILLSLTVQNTLQAIYLSRLDLISISTNQNAFLSQQLHRISSSLIKLVAFTRMLIFIFQSVSLSVEVITKF